MMKEVICPRSRTAVEKVVSRLPDSGYEGQILFIRRLVQTPASFQPMLSSEEIGKKKIVMVGGSQYRHFSPLERVRHKHADPMTLLSQTNRLTKFARGLISATCIKKKLCQT